MKITYWASIIILTVTNILVVVSLFQASKRNEEYRSILSICQENHRAHKLRYNEIKSNSIDAMSISNISLSKEILVHDSNNVEHNLTDLISGNPMLLFRIHDTDCFPCLKKYLSRISKYNSINGGNVIILADFDDKSMYLNEFGKYKIPVFFHSREPLIVNDTLGYPFFLVLDKSLNIKSGFIPIESDLKYLEDYLAEYESVFKSF